jgi:hypothetical protein
MNATKAPRPGAPGTLPPPLDHVGLLESALQAGFAPWHGARRRGLAQALLGLIGASSVNLTKVARACPGPAQVASHYRRLQRLLSGFAPLVRDGTLARRVAAWSGDPGPWALSLDRTEWQPVRVAGGLPWVNLLVLGLVQGGVAYPLVWTLLPRRGSSTEAQRLALLDRFLALFGPQAVRFVALDREFYGRAWLAGLAARGVEYRLRVCAAHRLTNARGQPTPVRHLCAHLAPGQAERWHGRRLGGQTVDVAVVRLPPEVCARTQAAKRAQGHGCPGDELVVVVAPHDPARAAADGAAEPALLADYRRRWGIETLFGALKSRGFDLEATHVVRYPERLERLVGLLALAFTWAHRTGQWVADHLQPPRFNARQGRRAKSLFRYGLDYLGHLLTPGAAADPVRQAHFRQLIHLLSCA